MTAGRVARLWRALRMWCAGAAPITSLVLTTATNYRRVSDLTFTFTPTATVDAAYTLSRSWSGRIHRRGWAWHAHFIFLHVTVY